MEFAEAEATYRALVEDLLAGRATLADAVARFAGPLRAAWVDDRADDEVEGLAWAAGGAVATAATDPAHHELLAELLAAVRALGPLLRAPGAQACTVWGLTVFTDLPCVGAQLREALDVHPTAAPVLFAFADRLDRDGTLDFSGWAGWTDGVTDGRGP